MSLHIHKYKRKQLLLLAAFAVIIPTIFSIINNMQQNTNAVTYQIPGGYTTITDPNFYDCVAKEFVKEFPDEEIPNTGLTDEQLGKITRLSCYNPNNVIGIDKFSDLDYLYVNFNGYRDQIDVSKNQKLTALTLYNGSSDYSDTVNILRLPSSLEKLLVYGVTANSIDWGEESNLKEIELSRTENAQFSLSTLDNLKKVLFQRNEKLASVILPDSCSLEGIAIWDSSLYTLDTQKCTNLKHLYLRSNKLSSIDISKNTKLESINVAENNISKLNISNNPSLGVIGSSNIIIETGILPIEENGNYVYDFSNLRLLYDGYKNYTYYYVGSSGGGGEFTQTIPDSSKYSFENKVLTIFEPSNKDDYVQVNTTINKSGIDNVYSFKLKLADLDETGGGDDEETIYELKYNTNYDEGTEYVGGVCKVDDAGSGTCNLDLADINIWRSGYDFLGWSTSLDATAPEYRAGDKITLNDNMTLYAVWKKQDLPVCNFDAININVAVCLQDMNDRVKASMTVGTQYQLKDSRDGKTYYVSKLADGNVWMTQNLDLGYQKPIEGSIHGYGKPISMSPDDTDISPSSSFFGFTDYDDYIDLGDYYIIPSGNANSGKIQSSGDAHYHIGNSYTWKVAHATGGASTGNEAPDSICPAGWKLPSKSEFQTFMTKYGLIYQNDSTGVASSVKIQSSPLYFVKASENVAGVGGDILAESGDYWSSTENGATKYSMRVLDNGVTIGDASDSSENTWYYSVRCIARNNNIYTLNYDLNGGTGDIAPSTKSSSHKRTQVNVTTEIPFKTGHYFIGWADTNDAKEATYMANDKVNVSGAKTLYAVWSEGQPTQAVTFNDSSATITKTYGDAKFTNAATTNGDGTITYNSSNTNVAIVNSSTGEVTIVGAGETTITAIASETDEYDEGSASYTLVVNKANPTATFTNTAVSKVYGDANFTNAVTTNSDGVVTYTSSDTSIATVNSSTGEVSILKAGGPITITATIAATSNYNAASASYTLAVSQYPSTISFTNTSVTKTYGDANFINAATTTSTSPIVYTSSDTAIATVNSSTGEVTIIKASESPITITASVAASADYAAASTSYTLIINRKISNKPSEVDGVKEGYVTDKLSTILLNTSHLEWDNPDDTIKEGYNGYAVHYTENGDTANYTTESFEIVIRGERRMYVTIDGDGQTYTLDTGEYTSFRFDADYNLFKEGGVVYIDSKLVDPQYYTSESGSTILNVSNDYLRTLSAGEHNLTARFNDGGEAKATFAIAKINDDGSEDTGDGTNGANNKDGNFLAVPNTGKGITIEVVLSIVTILISVTIITTIVLVRIRAQRAKSHWKFD